MDPSSSQSPSAPESPNSDQNPPTTITNLSHRPASRNKASDPAANASGAPIPDDDHGSDMPLTMSASVVLTSLPRDAHQALADAEAMDTGKGSVAPRIP
ncbi:hypothetical protein EYZ11_009573 [Aspergillus tanneri]|uniref:Uncharacterized protein n=1 Tax=Aspergillus tanneri TaxID=1220188 RepID=A0A4S3J810_9EURO|nr:hypothetical protein EYZ11_009573 [Aspergillus tanneri]